MCLNLLLEASLFKISVSNSSLRSLAGRATSGEGPFLLGTAAELVFEGLSPAHVEVNCKFRSLSLEF